MNFSPEIPTSYAEKPKVDIDKVSEGIQKDRQDYSYFKQEGLFNPKDIRADRRKAEGIQKGFLSKEEVDPEAKVRHKKAKHFEAFMIDQTGKRGWFPGAFMYVTKEYDDLINGVDQVMEIKKKDEPDTYLGLGVDVTFNSTDALVNDKLGRIVGDLRRGRLSEVKYFEKSNGQAGVKVPKIILALDQKEVDGLLGLWKSGNDKALEESAIQVKVLLQMKMQLHAFAKIARAHFQDQAAEVYEEALEEIYGMLAEKKEMVDRYHDLFEESPTYQTIKIFTEDLLAQAPAVKEETLEAKLDEKYKNEGSFA